MWHVKQRSDKADSTLACRMDKGSARLTSNPHCAPACETSACACRRGRHHRHRAKTPVHTKPEPARAHAQAVRTPPMLLRYLASRPKHLPTYPSSRCWGGAAHTHTAAQEGRQPLAAVHKPPYVCTAHRLHPHAHNLHSRPSNRHSVPNQPTLQANMRVKVTARSSCTCKTTSLRISAPPHASAQAALMKLATSLSPASRYASARSERIAS